jgi:serine phosphatase RsbU (regulator of sigma subunit)
MAILRARQGALEEAHAWLERVQELAVTIPSAWNTLFQGECEVEIASAEQNWSASLEAIEKLTTLQVRSGLRTNSARSLLCWADLHIRRGTPADIERGRVLLRESLTAFEEIGMGHYPDIAQKMLQMVRSKSYAQALDHENMTKDLKKARQVQESLLPANVPSLPGWGLAVVLNPAHETSGDFYDFLPLPDGRLGLIIADVTDKGTSAALFMALSRSLYRTFAADYPDNPEKTMSVTNHRILADTHGGLFITLFYGILNPLDGTFTYCSAGHYPAYLVRDGDGSEQELSRTGIPLGVLEEVNWNSAQVTIEHGDTLVLYTDGITDATNTEGQFFGKERLLDALRKHAGKPAREILDRVLSDVHTWMGDAQQFDDITLMVITREKMR